jgi:hypothetical protein
MSRRHSFAATAAVVVGLSWVGIVAAQSPDPFVGEWAPDKASCSEARLVFTADGRHEALMREADDWVVLSEANFQREGSVVRVFDASGSLMETLAIVAMSPTRLVLRNADQSRHDAIGIDALELARCVAR